MKKIEIRKHACKIENKNRKTHGTHPSFNSG